MRSLLPTLALLALGSSALAAPKPPATNVFEPEIGYTYASGNYMDLRLANRAGDKAILVHRTGFGKLRSFDLSGGESRMIVYVDDTELYLRRWTSNGGAVSLEPWLGHIGPLPGLPERPDISPDGSKIAVSILSPDQPGIFVHDFNPAPGDPYQKMVLQGWNTINVRWHPSEQALFFTGYRAGTTDPNSAYRLDLLATNDPATPQDDRVTFLFQTPGGLVDIDLTRPPVATESIRIAAHINNEIVLWSADGSRDRKVADGSLAHFNCSNDAIIHRAFATRRPPTRITYLAGGFETWSTDSNIHHTDWVPCA